VKCEVCGKTYPLEQSICPDDGTWLHEQTIMEIKPRSRRQAQSPPIDEFEIGPATDRHQKFRGSMASLGKHPTYPQPQPPPGEELAPGTQLGDYEVEEKVGEGAMGTVYRAVHPAIHKRVAIKVMSRKLFDEPEAVKRFVAEARAVAAIDHPSIVDVFGFGRIPDGRTYLVMEWLEGESLKARLEKGRLPFEEACDIIRTIARALEAAHGKGVVHRDLKPENVFLHRIDDDKPVVKLLDFGLAKQTKSEDPLVARTRTGQMLGTPLYMSPEQCKAKGVDHRTDIYALGCMCYELLVGHVPFEFDNVAELISAHLVVEPPRPTSFEPGFPVDLDKLLFNMIAKEPEKRPGLGEIRRIIGMQVSRPSQPIATVKVPEEATPPAPVDAPAPAGQKDITTEPVSRVAGGVQTRTLVIAAIVIAVLAIAVLLALR